MSLLKQILSPFVEFEADKKKESAPEVKTTLTPTYTTPPPVNHTPLPEVKAEHPLITGINAGSFNQQSAPTPATNAVPANKPAAGSTVLPEHELYFQKLIDDANATNPLFQGTDYKEFVDSKSDIDNITDEETRYKTAFNLLKRTGLSKEKLVSTAHEYHNIIGRDLNAFQGAHMQQYQKEVKQREQIIQKKAEELQALSVKINALKKEISQISQEMVDTKDRLNLTKNSFLLAGEKMQNDIQAELEKIGKYF
jgi:hypothetical protein